MRSKTKMSTIGRTSSLPSSPVKNEQGYDKETSSLVVTTQVNEENEEEKDKINGRKSINNDHDGHHEENDDRHGNNENDDTENHHDDDDDDEHRHHQLQNKGQRTMFSLLEKYSTLQRTIETTRDDRMKQEYQIQQNEMNINTIQEECIGMRNRTQHMRTKSRTIEQQIDDQLNNTMANMELQYTTVIAEKEAIYMDVQRLKQLMNEYHQQFLESSKAFRMKCKQLATRSSSNSNTIQLVGGSNNTCNNYMNGTATTKHLSQEVYTKVNQQVDDHMVFQEYTNLMQHIEKVQFYANDGPPNNTNMEQIQKEKCKQQQIVSTLNLQQSELENKRNELHIKVDRNCNNKKIQLQNQLRRIEQDITDGQVQLDQIHQTIIEYKELATAFQQDVERRRREKNCKEQKQVATTTTTTTSTAAAAATSTSTSNESVTTKAKRSSSRKKDTKKKKKKSSSILTSPPSLAKYMNPYYKKKSIHPSISTSSSSSSSLNTSPTVTSSTMMAATLAVSASTYSETMKQRKKRRSKSRSSRSTKSVPTSSSSSSPSSRKRRKKDYKKSNMTNATQNTASITPSSPSSAISILPPPPPPYQRYSQNVNVTTSSSRAATASAATTKKFKTNDNSNDNNDNNTWTSTSTSAQHPHRVGGRKKMMIRSSRDFGLSLRLSDNPTSMTATGTSTTTNTVTTNEQPHDEEQNNKY